MSQEFPLYKLLLSGAVAGSALLLGACNAGGGNSGTQAEGGPSFEARSNEVEGPLDPIQDQVIRDVVGGQLGGALPEPLGPTVTCLADATNSLVDAPDAVLAALTALDPGADPAAAFQAAADDVVGSLERFAAELQGTLTALAGGEACSTVAGGGGLPAIGAPGGNPLEGTPLEAVGAPLAELLAALGGFSGGGDDPNLTSVATTVNPILQELAAALNDNLPPEVKDAPVIGGLFATLSQALTDVQPTLFAAGDYNPGATAASTEALLNNLLSNVLLGVVPVQQLEEATGQDISGPIQDAINQGTAALADAALQILTPAFEELLDGALSPALDPVEALLAEILGGGLPGGGLPGGGLDDLLGIGLLNDLLDGGLLGGDLLGGLG